MTAIDLNCDIGEGYGIYRLGDDEIIMPYVTSVNVACGFHASDPVNMLTTVRLAKQYGVAVGAHPSYPDLAGFGRRFMALSAEEIRAGVMYQIGALQAICRAEGLNLQHVKAHGALYNAAAKDEAIAESIAKAIKAVDAQLYMICLANSPMVVAAETVGIKYVQEAFADRAYSNDGRLVPRDQAGAVIHDADAVATRVLTIARDRIIRTIDGNDISINADTVCIHGDTLGATAIIRAIRAKLYENSLSIKAFGCQV